jgi:hypothetical protein
MTTISSADALIDCFNKKGFYLFWRPQTAIREAANAGNPDTAPDPTWLSLFPNPGYPDMPSGYNCYTAANMTAGEAFFGTDNVAFDVTNTAGTRSYQFTGYVRRDPRSHPHRLPLPERRRERRADRLRPPSGWSCTTSAPVTDRHPSRPPPLGRRGR